MKLCSTILLVVGGSWLLFDLWLFLTLAGLTEPVSVSRVLLYWSGMFLGPTALIAGPVLLRRSSASKYGLVVCGIGCVYFTGFVLYNSFIGLQRSVLQGPPPYAFYVGLLVMMVLSDLAAYRIWRLMRATQAVRD